MRRPTERVAREFLSVEEIADRLGVSKMTVYRLIHNGELPAARIGHNFRIKREHFTEYLQAAFGLP